jgi:hypothetical protein
MGSPNRDVRKSLADSSRNIARWYQRNDHAKEISILPDGWRFMVQ